MKARCVSNLSVSVQPDGTLVFDRSVIQTCGLHIGGKVALLFDEPRQRLVIHPVPEWMGGIRLTNQSAGLLAAEKGLDYLFDAFEETASTKTYEAVWVPEGGFIIVRMALQRKAAVEQ